MNIDTLKQSYGPLFLEIIQEGLEQGLDGYTITEGTLINKYLADIVLGVSVVADNSQPDGGRPKSIMLELDEIEIALVKEALDHQIEVNAGGLRKEQFELIDIRPINNANMLMQNIINKLSPKG